MKNRSILLIVLIHFAVNLSAQDVSKVKSFQLAFEPITASIDRQGHLYFASARGAIEKYDQEGKLEYHYSPQMKAEPSLLEAWQGLRVFVYYDNFQEYLFLNRFLTDSERYDLGDFNLSQFNGVATLSADNNLWTVDSNNLMLRKVDLQNGEVLLDNNLALTLSESDLKPSYLREYQNLLFFSNQNGGILVFDNLGNFVEKLAAPALSFFSFSKNELIYLNKNKLTLIDIYKKEKREIEFDLPYQLILKENNLIFAQRGKHVDVFRIN